MTKEKLKEVEKVVSKLLAVKTTNISENKITLYFLDDKAVTLDFDQDYLRDIKENDIPIIIDSFKVISLIEDNNYEIINISEKGAFPYLGNI